MISALRHDFSFLKLMIFGDERCSENRERRQFACTELEHCWTDLNMWDIDGNSKSGNEY
jgi:hypothetical protein